MTRLASTLVLWKPTTQRPGSASRAPTHLISTCRKTQRHTPQRLRGNGRLPNRKPASGRHFTGRANLRRIGKLRKVEKKWETNQEDRPRAASIRIPQLDVKRFSDMPKPRIAAYSQRDNSNRFRITRRFRSAPVKLCPNLTKTTGRVKCSETGPPPYAGTARLFVFNKSNTRPRGRAQTGVCLTTSLRRWRRHRRTSF